MLWRAFPAGPAVFACLLGAALVQAATVAASVQFQDGSGNARQSFAPGDVAVFYVRDDSLGTTATSSATWTQIRASVPAGAWWSLATDAPLPEAYALSDGSAYETTTPASPPLHSVPSVLVGGVRTQVTEFRPQTGEFALFNDANALSTVHVEFDFDVVDSYPADWHRARVTSTSDMGGEWVSIAEVKSETDAGASPDSGVFRGETVLRDDSTAPAPGDGVGAVHPGDGVTVTYYDAGGETEIDSHRVPVVSVFPTPTPVPAPLPSAGWPTLGIIAGLFALSAFRCSRTRAG